MPIDPTALILARVQFAFTVSFHFIFPAFSIGLASFLAVLEGLWLATGKARYLDLFRYWLKIFAVAFAMGVVSGIVMSYQFGTNWAVFSDRAGPVIGPLMAYEVLTAFFLEAGFLGVMLFGMKKVGKRLHFGATLMVALGTAISAFWIISVNSWMHTPVGYAIAANGQFVPAGGWWRIVFNPSFPYRLVHTVIAAYLTTAFVVGGVGAWHLLRGAQDDRRTRTMFSMAMWMAALVAPVQIFAGDMQGLNTLEHQPAKVMAMEGHFESHPDGAPLYLFGIPDQANQRLDLRDRHPQGVVADPEARSRKRRSPGSTPSRAPTSRRSRSSSGAFRIMVGIGFAMLGLGLWSLWARARGALVRLRAGSTARRYSMGPMGFVAVIAGWVTTEVGRQPWTIYGVLRTADSVSPLGAPAVAASLAAFAAVYCAAFGVGIWYILKLMSAPPHAHESDVAAGPDAPLRSYGITPAAAGDDATGDAEPAPMNVDFDLATVWAFVIAFAVLMYVVMDGFDLGIGIVFPVFAPGEERDAAMNAIAPVWDGNETWLVLGGGGLMAAFPLAYAIILPATYPLIIAMLLGLVFRGVAFEFRWRDPRHRAFWDFAFTAGSLVAAAAQGMVLGALLQGIKVADGRAYAGGWLDWLTPYSLLTGAGTVAGYALLGTTFLAIKTEGRAADHAYRLARRAASFATLGLMAAVSLATPFLVGQYHERWFSMPGLVLTAPVPLLVALARRCCCSARWRSGAPTRRSCAASGCSRSAWRGWGSRSFRTSCRPT